MSKKSLKRANSLYSLLLGHPHFEFDWALHSLNHDGSVTLTKGEHVVKIYTVGQGLEEYYVANVDGHDVYAWSVSALADLMNGLGSYVTVMNTSQLSL